jgi:primary-amine oxidase
VIRFCRAFCLLLVCLGFCARAAAHPLDPLTPAEIRSAFALLQSRFAEDAALPHQDLVYPLLALWEPDKSALSDNRAAPPRMAEAQIFHWPSNRLWLARLDLVKREVSTLTRAPDGSQPALSSEEYEAAAQLVRAHEPWRTAVRARGAEPEHVHVDVWAPGHVAFDDALLTKVSHGKATRLVRCLSFANHVKGAPPNPQRPVNPYLRPLDGLIALVDMNARRIVQISDLAMEQAISSETGNAEREDRAFKPLQVKSPQGPSFALAGQELRWGIWQFRVALHPREGLVLYDVRVEARAAMRKVAHRMSLSEIYVPYGFGDEEWSWRSAFDVGEYNPGTATHELAPGYDVPDNARFLAATLASSRGPSAKRPDGSFRIARAIAVYERDAGVLWSRTDPASGARDTRFARELVVTWSTWIGNYIYGFDWIFKQDGSLEVQVELTGTTLNRTRTARAERGAPKVGKDREGVLTAAPTHQHFFNFRLDLDVDGPDNHVMESELRQTSDSSFANAFDKHKAALTAEGARDAAPLLERKWCVMSSREYNVLGERPAFTLEPGALIKPLSRADYPGLARAAFAQHALWVSRYAEDERFAAGPFPSQASVRDGVSQYVTPPSALTPERGDDLVLWYTLGLSHVPKLEDYPVMNSERIGFRLAPHGFFDRNPALGAASRGRAHGSR